MNPESRISITFAVFGITLHHANIRCDLEMLGIPRLIATTKHTSLLGLGKIANLMEQPDANHAPAARAVLLPALLWVFLLFYISSVSSTALHLQFIPESRDSTIAEFHPHNGLSTIMQLSINVLTPSDSAE